MSKMQDFFGKTSDKVTEIIVTLTQSVAVSLIISSKAFCLFMYLQFSRNCGRTKEPTARTNTRTHPLTEDMGQYNYHISNSPQHLNKTNGEIEIGYF
jgi:hypothetical protein